MKKYLFIALLMLSTTFYAADKTEPSKLDDVLATVVEKGLALAEQTGTFVIEQAPDLLKEFYQWHIYSSIFSIIIGLLLVFLGYRIPIMWTTKEKDDCKYFNRYCYDSFGHWACFITSSVIGVPIIILNIYKLIFISVAPKLYLIEYFIK